MLLTITRGKAGRLQLPGSDLTLSWRDIFKAREDLLTGVVFGRFRFMSAACMQMVMAYLIGEEHAERLGNFRRLDLWPKLKKLEGRAWVEPDVLLTFQHAHVLVEVKPPEGGWQMEQQWRDEVLALVADDVSETLNLVHFIALGNTRLPDGPIPLTWDERVQDIELYCHAREWTSMVSAITLFRSFATGADAAVFDDWQEALELFGLAPKPKDWSALVSWSNDQSLELKSAWDEVPVKASASPDASTGPWSTLLPLVESHRLELPEWT